MNQQQIWSQLQAAEKEPDGRAEKSWQNAAAIPLDNNLMPGTDPKISGQWKMTYDQENLYILVEMRDPRNYLGRMIKFDIANTDYEKFVAYRTDELDENYVEIGEYSVEDGVLEYLSPNHSITTFVGVK